MNRRKAWQRASLRAGPYRLLAALGRGGMADVFLATSESALGVGKIQVLKCPRGELDDPEFVEMFLDEGRLAARIDHPNVVRTAEVAVYDGAPYIVMEYVEGQSLYRLVHDARRGKLELERSTCLFIISEVLEGLSHAHALRDFNGSPLCLVHRDLSPGNVLLSYSGEVKICDFGVAKATLRSSQTTAGTIKGKAGYMAPEQRRGLPVDQRADLYAVGVLLWELLAGRSLVTGDAGSTRVRGPSPLEGITDVGRELGAVCAKALADDPADRFQSADEMLDALEPMMESMPKSRNRRQLAALLCATYATERDELAQLVRRRIERSDAGHSEAPIPKVGGSSLPPEPTSVSVRPQKPPPEPSSKRVFAGAAAALLVGLGLVALVVGRGSWSGGEDPVAQASPVVLPSPASSGTPPSSSSLPTASAAPVPAPKVVEIRVIAIPSYARIRLDGELLDGNPISTERERDGKTHRIVVEAGGYEPAEHEVSFDENVSLRVKLEQLPIEAGDEAGKEPSFEEKSATEPLDDEPQPLDLDQNDPWAP